MISYDKLEPGQFYHIYNRGNNREDLFIEERNYRYFLRLYDEHVSGVADTYTYSLLKNHFHLLLKTKELNELGFVGEINPEKKIYLAFSNFFNAYAKSINSGYHRSGSLFQERFRRTIIDSPDIFKELIFYIHANAQCHNLTTNFFTYPHSSFLSLLSNKPTKLKREEVLAHFGGREEFLKQHEKYRDSILWRP